MVLVFSNLRLLQINCKLAKANFYSSSVATYTWSKKKGRKWKDASNFL